MAHDERHFQERLYCENCNSFEVLLPNYTPDKWWECDLFGVTRAGYFHEFEIKLTLADFRNDSEKRKRDYDDRAGGYPFRVKYEQLAAANRNGPVTFWYCTPPGLIPATELPPWAGLQEIDERRWRFSVIKKAPRIHREKLDSQVTRHALSVCYARFWSERLDFQRFKRNLAEQKERIA